MSKKNLSKHLILIVQDGCPPCWEAKKILTDKGASYVEVKKNSIDFNKLNRRLNVTRFPTLVATSNLSVLQDSTFNLKPSEVELVWRGRFKPESSLLSLLSILGW